MRTTTVSLARSSRIRLARASAGPDDVTMRIGGRGDYHGIGLAAAGDIDAAMAVFEESRTIEHRLRDATGEA